MSLLQTPLNGPKSFIILVIDDSAIIEIELTVPHPVGFSQDSARSFNQLGIWSMWHYVNVAFCQFGIMSMWHFVNVLFADVAFGQ